MTQLASGTWPHYLARISMLGRNHPDWLSCTIEKLDIFWLLHIIVIIILTQPAFGTWFHYLLNTSLLCQRIAGLDHTIEQTDFWLLNIITIIPVLSSCYGV